MAIGLSTDFTDYLIDSHRLPHAVDRITEGKLFVPLLITFLLALTIICWYLGLFINGTQYRYFDWLEKLVHGIKWIFALLITGCSEWIVYQIVRQETVRSLGKVSPTTISLVREVEKYHNLIKAIDIYDQLQAVGNPTMISDRDQVIGALSITRQDLICAFQTEKIMRENEGFVRQNSDFFASGLTALQALQVSENASEYGRVLNGALEIGMDIQKEMRNLQESLTSSGGTSSRRNRQE